MLVVEGLTVRFGGVVALHDVSFQVSRGTVTGLIGANGAGKSTCVDALSGFVTPVAGRVTFNGQRIDAVPPHGRARRGLVRTFQSLELFDHLTVRGNLEIAADRQREDGGAASAVRQALEVTGLVGVAERHPRELPAGQRRLVAMARAIASRPRLVLLDEPAAGLVPEETRVLADGIRVLPALGITVLLIDHDMSLVMSTSDTVWVLDHGRMIAHGPPAEVQTTPAVLRAYLGEPAAHPPAAHSPAVHPPAAS